MTYFIRNNFMIIGYIILVCAYSSGVFMLNQGDYSRSIMPFSSSFDLNIHVESYVSHFTMRDDFLSPLQFSYISSHNFLLYIYALVTSIFSDEFSITIYTVLMKVLILTSLYILLLSLSGKFETNYKKQILFILASFPFLASSNMALASSLYQEQLLLILVPALITTILYDTKTGIYSCFFFAAAIATLKSQFFYMPLIVMAFFAIYSRKNIKLKFSLMLLALSFGIVAILLTRGTTNLNSYHSTYYGAYLYNSISQKENPHGVDDFCIGVDAWGNRFDENKGIVSTDIKDNCIKDAENSKFSDAIFYYIKNPVDFIMLPFSESVKPFLGEDYFHMDYNYKLIVNQDNMFGKITEFKDALFDKVRFPALVLMLLASIAFRKRKIAGPLFVISFFGVTQFYISFLGEGYRDLNKHLSGMNICFDMLIYIVTIKLVYSALAVMKKRTQIPAKAM